MIMKSQHEFFLNRKSILNSLFRMTLGTVIVIAAFFYFFFKDTLNPWILFCFIFGFLILLHQILRLLKEYNFHEPALIVRQNSIVFRVINNFFKIIETEIRIDEIKSIGTDKKMDGERVKYKLLNIRLINSKEHRFNIDAFGLTHDDMIKLIMDLNPDAKILNIGEFEFD